MGVKRAANFTERNEKIYELFKSGKTLEEIAEQFGVSKERVRQILAKRLKEQGYPSFRSIWLYKKDVKRREEEEKKFDALVGFVRDEGLRRILIEMKEKGKVKKVLRTPVGQSMLVEAENGKRIAFVMPRLKGVIVRNWSYVFYQIWVPKEVDVIVIILKDLVEFDWRFVAVPAKLIYELRGCSRRAYFSENVFRDLFEEWRDRYDVVKEIMGIS